MRTVVLSIFFFDPFYMRESSRSGTHMVTARHLSAAEKAHIIGLFVTYIFRAGMFVF